jgi:hypothetical protein
LRDDSCGFTYQRAADRVVQGEDPAGAGREHGIVSRLIGESGAVGFGLKNAQLAAPHSNGYGVGGGRGQ